MWRLSVAIGLLWAQGVDSLPVYTLSPVTIEALQAPRSAPGETSIEQLQRLGLIQPVYRSVPFAQEVVYQGLLPTQTTILIEGMRVLPACVDRMDPVLTFVEGTILEEAAWTPRQQWGATPKPSTC